MPVAVGIGLTNECNLACPHCYRPTLTQQRLSVPEVETILDNLDVGSVNLGVGENGVHPEYRKMLTLLRDREIKTVRKPFERLTQARTVTGRFQKKRKPFMFVTIPRLEKAAGAGVLTPGGGAKSVAETAGPEQTLAPGDCSLVKT